MTGLRTIRDPVIWNVLPQNPSFEKKRLAINLLASPETIDQEFRVYDSIRDNFPKYVVSLDEFDMSRNGIKHRNIREYLLMPEWN